MVVLIHQLEVVVLEVVAVELLLMVHQEVFKQVEVVELEQQHLLTHLL